MSEKEPTPYNQKLFQHMEQEHGLTLVESELAEIIRIVRGIEEKGSES